MYAELCGQSTAARPIIVNTDSHSYNRLTVAAIY